ncbi:phytanoyl-CoA dioxygenase family protein [Pseudomonas sp. COR18]|uniref:phytanoyl-CoA dioxygenase family protein n=1 Tax=Pseudomonas sp. COR18 TaxID=3399680 RepID=UPI003AFFD689
MPLSNTKFSLQCQGFDHVCGAFDATTISKLSRHADDQYDPTYSGHRVIRPNYHELAIYAPYFADSRIVDKIENYLGARVKLSLLELALSPPLEEAEDAADRTAGYDSHSGLGIHFDGAWLEKDIGLISPPPLTTKVAIWLSDVSSTGGCLRVYPGSHLTRDDIAQASSGIHQTHDIEAHAGDITFFDRRLLHTRTINRSPVMRKVLFMEYSVTWLRRKQPLEIDEATKACISPLARRLLASPTDPWEDYWP